MSVPKGTNGKQAGKAHFDAVQRNALLKVVDRIFGLEDHAVDCDHAVVRKTGYQSVHAAPPISPEAKPQTPCVGSCSRRFV